MSRASLTTHSDHRVVTSYGDLGIVCYHSRTWPIGTDGVPDGVMDKETRANFPAICPRNWVGKISQAFQWDGRLDVYFPQPAFSIEETAMSLDSSDSVQHRDKSEIPVQCQRRERRGQAKKALWIEP